MRVLHVIKAVGIAGAERHLLTLVPGLRERGIDAEILLLVEPAIPLDNFVAQAAACGVPVQREIIRRDLDVRLVQRLRGIYAEKKPDVVHTHLLHADLFGVPAARLAGVPVIVTTRHNDNVFRRRLHIRLTNQTLWHMVSGGIAISEAIRRFCIDVEHAPAENVRTIYYGLDAQTDEGTRQARRAAFRAELGVTPETPVVGMVCRLIEQKGIRYAIEAFARIAPQFPDALFVIAGDGPLRKALGAQAKTLGVEERVRFLGWREDTLTVFAGLDLLLMPSLWEGFGLVMLEAMSQRVPILGSAVSAIPEVVADGVTGRLVPPRDAAALADVLAQLIADAPLRRHMGLLGEERLEEAFSAARMIDDTAALYRQLLSKKV